VKHNTILRVYDFLPFHAEGETLALLASSQAGLSFLILFVSLRGLCGFSRANRTEEWRVPIRSLLFHDFPGGVFAFASSGWAGSSPAPQISESGEDRCSFIMA
jgi:hypothetical protein